MKVFFCGTVLTTVFLAAVGLPTNLITSQDLPRLQLSKEQKQSLFGWGVDVNLSKESSLIPIPSFLNLNANYADGHGASGNLIVPLAFPLGLMFPGYPPLNISFGVNVDKNVAVGINHNAVSSGADATEQEGEGEVDAGWGWTTPAPAGWGWNSPPAGWAPSTPGWAAPTTTQGWAAPTTTQGWAAPTTTPGWAAPTTTQGWAAPTTTQGWAAPTTTPGWAVPTTTPGWAAPTTTPGWSPPPPGWKSPQTEKQELRKAPGSAYPSPSKPQPPQSAGDKEKPKPQSQAKPIPSISDSLQQSMPDKGSETQSQSFIVDVAESSLSSELPSISVAPLAEQSNLTSEQALAAAATAQANAHHQNEVHSDSHPYFAILEDDNTKVFVPETPLAQDEIPSELAQGAALKPNSGLEGPLHHHPKDVRISVPIAPLAGKARRHAGVEAPAVLRVEDFDDVESPAVQPQSEGAEEEEISKEEMILMAMEQLSGQLPPGIQFNIGGRPAATSGNRPTSNLFGSPNTQTSYQQQQIVTYNSPASVDAAEPSDGDFSEKEEDESQEEEEAEDADGSSENKTPAEDQDQKHSPVTVEKVEAVTKPESKGPEGEKEKPGRNKPRPYGMDRPSKHKPHSESGIKNEQFGLPHASNLQHKGQENQMVEPTTVMGFQIPSFKWSSISDIFQHFMGSRHRNKKGGLPLPVSISLGKSDEAAFPPISDADEKCVDDDDEDVEGTRSRVIYAGGLCPNSNNGKRCNEGCQNRGFSSGTCLGPNPTPGCLCKVPNHNEYGMMLKPLEEESSNKGLQQSENLACKKCACEESCKAAGSYTGFCMGKCHCANPWYTKV